MSKKRKSSYYAKGKSRNPMRHAFRFNVCGKIVRKWAKVKGAVAEVILMLTRDDVLRAIELNGHGDGQNCAGAVCCKRHGSIMPHPFAGYADWWYNRVYIATRVNSDNFPTHCVAYAHKSQFAKFFDSKTGLNKLLAIIEKNGPIEVRITPLPKYDPNKVRHKSGPSGAHTKRAVGHKLRIMRATEGGFGIQS